VSSVWDLSIASRCSSNPKYCNQCKNKLNKVLFFIIHLWRKHLLNIYVHIAIHTFVCQLHISAVARQAIYRQEQQQPSYISATLVNLYIFAVNQKLMDSPSKSALIPWSPEDSVWKRSHVDFAGPIRNHYFMVVVDSYSKRSEVVITKQITSNFTVEKLREMFCRYGLIDA